MKKSRTLRTLDIAELTCVHGATESDSLEDATQPQASHARPLTGFYDEAMVSGIGGQMRPKT